MGKGKNHALARFEELTPTETDEFSRGLESVVNSMQTDYWRANANGERLNLDMWVSAYHARSELALSKAREQYVQEHQSWWHGTFETMKEYYQNDMICNLFLYNIFLPLKAIVGFMDGGRGGLFRVASAGVSFAALAGVAAITGMNKDQITNAIPYAIALGVVGDVVASPILRGKAQDKSLAAAFNEHYAPLHREQYKRIEDAVHAKYIELDGLAGELPASSK